MTANRENRTGLPHWLKLTGIILLLSIVFLAGLTFLFFRQFDVWGPDGPYTINEIVLTDKLDENAHPIGYVDKFRPDQQIICWVATKGAEGIIGMRFYYEEKLIFEHFGKTQDNQLFTYIQSSADVTLPEGKYRLEVGITPGKPLEVLYFTVEPYSPRVVPPQPTPINHKDLEESAFPDVPFAFDEVWTIGRTDWRINEVKVTFLEERKFVSVAVEVDFDLSKLSEEQAFAITKPIATYAVRNDYLERAEDLQIDGEFYSLDEIIYVNLVSKDLKNSFEQTGKRVYRVGFNVKDLLEPSS